MKLNFTKMQGAGNDYIYIDCRAAGLPPDAAAWAVQLSRRHFSVGADAAVPFETYEAASRHWVDGTLEPAEVKAWLDQLPVQKRAAEVWRESLLRRGDLARRILELVPRA